MRLGPFLFVGILLFLMWAVGFLVFHIAGFVLHLFIVFALVSFVIHLFWAKS
jgi:hypothetical protein